MIQKKNTMAYTEIVEIDGVLFSQDMTHLVRYPSERTGDSYFVPHTVKVIDEEAFAKNKNLYQVILPDSLKQIEAGAFLECAKLTKINFTDHLEYIGAGSFGRSMNIRRLHIPAGVKVDTSVFATGCVIWSPESSKGDVYDCLSNDWLSISYAGPAIISRDYKKLHDFIRTNEYDHFEHCHKDKNGILWADHGKTLICFPETWKSDIYKLPDHVEKVYVKAFCGTKIKYFWSEHDVLITGEKRVTPEGMQPTHGNRFRLTEFGICSEV